MLRKSLFIRWSNPEISSFSFVNPHFRGIEYVFFAREIPLFVGESPQSLRPNLVTPPPRVGFPPEVLASKKAQIPEVNGDVYGGLWSFVEVCRSLLDVDSWEKSSKCMDDQLHACGGKMTHVSTMLELIVSSYFQMSYLCILFVFQGSHFTKNHPGVHTDPCSPPAQQGSDRRNSSCGGPSEMMSTKRSWSWVACQLQLAEDSSCGMVISMGG